MSEEAPRPVALAYETAGEGEPVVLLMGLGRQLVDWPEPLWRGLVARGLRVIRPDNRDVGLSPKLSRAARPRVGRLLLRTVLGLRPGPAPYTLSDMAADVVRLLDDLGLDSAHLVGSSLGGTIAQTVAIEHADRVRSLTSLMSSAGLLRDFRPGALRAVSGAPPRSAEDLADRYEVVFGLLAGPCHPRDPAELRAVAHRAWERGYDGEGLRRQVAAVVASGSRLPALRGLRTPTLIVHGALDPLVRPAAARRLARAIPGARLEILPELGHDLAPALVPRLVRAIAGHVEGAGAESLQMA